MLQRSASCSTLSGWSEWASMYSVIVSIELPDGADTSQDGTNPFSRQMRSILTKMQLR